MTLSQVSSPFASSLVSSFIRTHLCTQIVVITVGSPPLAAYSLVLTSLNTRSVYRRARHASHWSKIAVAATLASLQQAPLELTKDKRLLDLIPIDDQWRREIQERLNPRNVWSVKAVIFAGWVAIPFVFTIVSTFISLNDSNDVSYRGYALGTLWLWLPCLVIGWSWLPTFSSSELKTALNFTNHRAVERAAKESRQASETTGEAAAKAKTASGPPSSILPRSKKRIVDPVPEVNEENEKVEVELIQKDTKHTGEEIDQKASRFSNPTHHQSTAPYQSPPEGPDHTTVSASPITNRSAVSVASSTRSLINPREEGGLFILKNGPNPLNRDEFRLAVTFNYSRILGYLALVDDVFRALNVFTRERGEVGFSRRRLILEAVSPILNRRGLSLGPLPLRPWRGLCSLRER
jgi:hypothetical protein